MTLNETGSFYGGLTGKRKEDFTNGSHNFISYKQIYSNISISSEGNSRVVIHPNEHQNEVRFGDILFTGSSESREEAGFTAVVTQEFQKPTYLNSFSIGFRPSDEYAQQLNPEFTKFLFRCQSLRNQIMKAANGVTRFNVSKQRLGMIKVPIPPLEEQQRIVNILDKFDALVNDLTSGLPAEIEARRKQYEFYRDQLLTFKELSA
ncbi:restriction endonuclease subunit S [Corynebacterium sp. LK24]|uniref:restriction endonuclease subunit S n=1 Tax=Corynebacterium sp. LK24 TaxID=2044583 RepID=UPI0016522E4F|nr:restriction endonuclease subunit S [Corynebacterium sp. LK24]